MNSAYRTVWNDSRGCYVVVAETARSQRKGGSSCRSLVTLSLVLASALSEAAPVGGNVSAGSASIAASGSTTTINQNTARAIIDWSSFSIAGNETVRFNNGAGATLNRVAVGAPTSVIDGLLASSGSVYLINSAGVIIGRNGEVRVGGSFVASTQDLSNNNFMAGGALSFSGNSEASVTNLGKIGASGGDVILIAAQVANQGEIQAANGRVGLLGGYQVLVKDQADQDGRFVIGLGGTSTSVTNAGLLQATAAELRTENGNVYALAGNTQGLIRATEVSGQGGQIWLSAPGGTVQVGSGATLDASAGSAGSAGGSISVQAAADHNGSNGVVLLDGTITASSSSGAAGSVAVSGRQIVESGAIHADGTGGGNVTVQGVGLLQSGTISADGLAGPGGVVALSTQGNLIQTASAKTSANSTNGVAGTVQLTSAGSLFSSGKVTANGQRGGTISALGQRVALAAADFEANGVQGGGQINIGGGLHGSGSQTADTTVVNASTTLAANATDVGDGGQVVVWSNTKTTFLGTVNARAGQQGGNGGLIEASSGDQLVYGGVANASAPAGAAGRLLLDPKNITISATAGDVASANLIDPNAGSGSGFGTAAVQLSNGSYVVTKPGDTVAGNSSAGSVYFYNGTTGGLMSALQGSHANDQVGSGGLLFLNYQNWYNTYYIGTPLVNDTTKSFLILSPSWNGTAGAISWVNANGSLSGTVSSSNSLLGSTANDYIGNNVNLLPNNNYVSIAPQWNTGMGAVTFGSAASGVSGVISSSNSLVGTHGTIVANNNLGGDQVGSNGITILSNGNFVVDSPYWNQNAGAVTLIDKSSGLTGVVSATNSLVGNAGTWYSATCSISCSNGTNSGTSYGYYNGDSVGNSVLALSNGYYAVVSSAWGHGRGAVTIGNGTSGVTGTVSAANSLVGTTQGIGDSGGNTYYTSNYGYRAYYGGDAVGSGGVTDLGNGNVVVSSTNWSSNIGAVTFMSLTSPLTGAVSSSNSLVGSTAGAATGYDSTYHQNYISGGDQVGSVTKLSNSNYVVTATAWNGRQGAVTFGSGTSGITGTVSSSNSLVGSSSGDNVGSGGIVSLSDNDYVVLSPVWNSYRGAVTRGSGSTGVTGSVSSSNSIVGTTGILGGNNPYNLGGDQVGSGGIVNLSNGDWVVLSPNWAQQKGAVTLMTAAQATSGNVTSGNSLVGSTASTQFNGSVSGNVVSLFGGDQVGSGGILTLSNNGGSNYLVLSPLWGGNKGAISFINPSSATVGDVSSSNSLVGQYSGTVNTYNYSGNVYKQYENGDAIGTGGSANYFYKSDQNLWMTNVVVQANNDYVVFSPLWNNNRGAVSYGNGSSGATGVVGSSNSLVGSTAGTLSSYAQDNGTFSISTTGGDQVGYGGMQYVSGNNYLVFSSQWNSQAGAVTYVSYGGAVTGAVSSSNSLIGSTAGDQVGSGGVALLSGGDYVISSPSWNGGRGAATWSNSTGGITGTVNTGNSLAGATANSSQTVSALNSAKEFLVARPSDGSGTVTLAFTDPTLFTYGFMSGLDVTIAPSLILQTLNSGTSVTLQANNDITVNSAIAANSGSTAGLTLDAGRSIAVNAAIDTGNGDLTLTANDTASHNVVNADRDSGAASISVASGANLSAGSGMVNITLDNGAGNTNNVAGNITLASSIGAGSISVKNLGTQNGSITLSSGAALTASANNGTITLQTGGNFINNAGASALSVPNGSWLVYSAGPSGDTFGNLNSNNTAVWNTAAGASVSASGNRYVFAYQPHLTVTSTNGSKTYGVDASSAIQSDYTISGLQPAVSGAYLADTAAMVYSGAPSMSSSGTAVGATVAGGPYTISGAAGTLSVGNGYGATTFTNSGQLTVNPATLIITASDQTATYGTPYTLSTALNTGYTQTGLVNSDAITGLTETIPGGLTATTASTAVGNYTITPAAATGTGLGNYTIQYHTGTLNLQPAILYTSLSYSVADAFSTYGTLATLGNSTLTGILNNDQVFGTVGAFTQGGSSVTLAANTAVGSYVEKVTGLTGSGASNYVLASSGNTNGTLTIQPRAVTLSGSQTYNGSTIAQGGNLAVGNLVGGDSVTVGGTATLASAHVGNRALSGFNSLTLDNANYTLTGASGGMTINPLAVTLSGSQTYNGTATAQGSHLAVSNLIGGDSVTVGGTATLDSVHAGSRTLSGFNSLSLSNSDYTLTGASGGMTINPLAVTLSGSQTYNGTATAQGSHLAVSNLIGGDSVTVGGTATLDSIHAGNRTLSGFNSLSLSNSDYTLTGASGGMTINPLAVTLSGSQTYNGTATAQGSHLTVSNLIGGDSVTVGGTATLDSIHAGNRTLSGFNSLSLSNSDYTLTGASGGMTINPLAVTLSGSQTYNGTATAQGSHLAVSNLIGGDSVTVGGTATLDSIHAGNRTLSGFNSLSLSNSDYTLTGASGGMTINPLAVTLSGSQTYNGTATAQGSNLAVSNLIGGDGVTVGGTATLDSVHAGSRTLSGFNSLSLSNSDYTLTGASGGMTINPLAVTLSGSQTYNGTATAQGSNLAVSNLIGGDSVTVGGTATLDSIHAGNRTLSGFNSLSLSNSDYTLTGASGGMTINPLAVTLSGSQTYNGTATAQGSNLAVSNLIGGDSVTVGGTATLDSIHAGNRTLSGFNSLSLSNSDYTLTGASGGMTINPLAVTLSGSQTYNGTATAQGSNLAVSNLIGGDSVTVGGTATLASAHVGNRTLSGFNSLSLSNSDYTLTGASGGMTINPLAVTLSGSQTYNGTATAQGSNLAVSNLIGGDSATVGGTATLDSTHAGSRTLSGFNSLSLSNSDYTLTGASGGMTINPLAVTLSGSQTYNGTATAQGSNLAVSNLIGGDSVTVGGTAGMTGMSVGSQQLTALSGLALSNADYTLSGGSGSLTVMPAALTISAANQTTTRGTAYVLAGHTTSGLFGSDSVTNVTETLAGGATSTTPLTAAGSYVITASNAIGSGLSNYNIAYQPGTLTVNVLPTINVQQLPANGQNSNASNFSMPGLPSNLSVAGFNPPAPSSTSTGSGTESASNSSASGSNSGIGSGGVSPGLVTPGSSGGFSGSLQLARQAGEQLTGSPYPDNRYVGDAIQFMTK